MGAQEIAKKFGSSEKDTGSVAVQVAFLTERINELTPHLAANQKDLASKRGLMKIIGKRRRLLKYLKNKDEASYQKTITALDIRK